MNEIRWGIKRCIAVFVQAVGPAKREEHEQRTDKGRKKKRCMRVG